MTEAGARDPRLWNHDLAPSSPEKRTWTTWNIAALWIGMAICIPTYTLASSLVDQGWIEKDFIPVVQQRGAAIIKARGLSSAASAASAAVDHVRDWALGSNGKWVSMAVPSDGSYGIKPGVVYGYPCTTKNGQYEIVQGLSVDSFIRGRMDATEKELREERAAIEELLR